MRKTSLIAASLCLVLSGSAAFADEITEISRSAFNAGAGLITFSEFPLNTVNPVYAPSNYGGGTGAPTVTFGGYFNGQTAGASNPSACPVGAAVTGCVLGNPTGPLAINPKSPLTFITQDSAMPTSPVLSGSPQFNGSIAIEFSSPQTGVGLDGGYFDAIGSTAITAYGADGSILGSVKNSKTGDVFLGLVTTNGQADIAGLLFSLVGDEPAGFDIDNVQFGTGSEVTTPAPEPASIALFGTGLIALAAVGSRKFA